MRLRKMIFSSLLALFVFFLIGGGKSVQAASYDNNTLTSYGIPATVVEVMMNNSMYADGKSPTQEEPNLKPTEFTVGDVTELQVVSLANRMGSYQSTANSTVADWVANGAANSVYDISPNVYAQNTEDKVTGDSGSLANKALIFDGHTLDNHYAPPFNMLMQIIASANNATTVDLTGVTSEVKDTTLAQSLISLFQTPRLSSLNTLLLGDDNLTDFKFYMMGQTVMDVTDAQNVTALDLSNNGTSQVAWGQNFPIMRQLDDLDLAGNQVATISDTLNNMLQSIVKHAGTTDMSSSSLQMSDWNTLQNIIAVLNATEGDIKLSDKSVNDIVNSQPQALNDGAVAAVFNQLNTDSIQKLLSSNNSLSEQTKTALTHKLSGKDDSGGTGGTSTAGNNVAVSGNLDFGTNSLSDLDSTFQENGSLDFTATLLPGSKLTATLASWTGQDGSFFGGIITLPNNGIFNGDINLNNTNSPVLSENKGNAPVTLTQHTLTGITLNIPEDQQTRIRATSYKTTITWHVNADQSANQN
ncbi:hypothetical protein IWT5_02185 [Secundilactobacillus silagincola]|uniref:WxL domain-containing protein n=2 Tax=Secundilactobacillus silagincola TaxID=1714681 RepID=A0A1Z5J4R0_9LACO|nr:hypothetical protein IWT5_02185 [Secundilactobacillus silagincola]